MRVFGGYVQIGRPARPSYPRQLRRISGVSFGITSTLRQLRVLPTVSRLLPNSINPDGIRRHSPCGREARVHSPADEYGVLI